MIIVILSFLGCVWIMELIANKFVIPKIELYILIDSDSRICYTGEYQDLLKKQTPELKLIKLEGVLE